MSENLSKTQAIRVKLDSIARSCEEAKHAVEAVARLSDSVSDLSTKFNDMRQSLSNLETESRIYRLQHGDMLTQHNEYLHGKDMSGGIIIKLDRLESSEKKRDWLSKTALGGLIMLGIERIAHFFK